MLGAAKWQKNNKKTSKMLTIFFLNQALKSLNEQVFTKR